MLKEVRPPRATSSCSSTSSTPSWAPVPPKEPWTPPTCSSRPSPAASCSCIGATTLDEYRKHIEKDAALERRFQPVKVEEPNVEDTIAILKRPARSATRCTTGIRIQDAALVAAANLSDRYISDRFLPDKAIDLIDEAAARSARDRQPPHPHRSNRAPHQAPDGATGPQEGARQGARSGSRRSKKELSEIGVERDRSALAQKRRCRRRSATPRRNSSTSARRRRKRSAPADLETASMIHYGKIPEHKPR